MDLSLNLGDSPAKAGEENLGIKLGFCMGLDIDLRRRIKVDEENRVIRDVDPPVQLNLLPCLDIWNLESVSGEEAEKRGAIRKVSSLHMNFAVNVRALEEKENDKGRKKLRLSKEQSAFLEDSFKEQNTLNSKMKIVLAKQLNLRPRQIEVWFQNRRARTKLKKMEMDCHFLKHRCEALRDENRRLEKEVSDLRVIKNFNTNIPPTTLSICPSCEIVPAPTSPPPPSPTPR